MTSSNRAPAFAMGAVVLALGLALTGCVADVPHPTMPAATRTEPPTLPSGDGVLRIGTLFPMTGDQAASGAAQVAGTELAARDIGAGGVLGQPIELVHRNSADDAVVALADLISRGVDVVLWDAMTAVPAEVTASVAGTATRLLPLRAFANGGTPLAAGDEFAERMLIADPGLERSAGGAEAYDAIVLSALAATSADDDGGASVEAGWKTVSTGPIACFSWGECLAALRDGQRIGYEGATGAIRGLAQ
jgi:branched-chain amino acid transport system substrate-binding protein